MSSASDAAVCHVITSISCVQSIVVVLIIVVITLNVVYAVIGSSLGFTRLYIRVLLALFEWGREKIRSFDESKEEEEQVVDPVSDGFETSLNGKIPIYYSDRYIASRKSVKIDVDHGFQLADAMYFFRKGMQVIVEDSVTQRFDAAELPSWNLLTRTNTHYEFISWRLSFLWLTGCILRLGILLPFRAILFVISMLMLVIGTILIGLLPEGRMKRVCNYRLTLASSRVLMRSFMAVITFHDRQNRAEGGGICVANHTSPLDVFVLDSDNCYALVGQKQGGFMGFLQQVTSLAEHHIWFQRSEARDRLAVVNRLREHVDHPTKRPILIFPEGTCVNNTSIMMFKKGSFEIGRKVYPVAIKYDTRFADAFWNSSKQNLLRHFLNILSSWALVADVWYLPPETQSKDETAIDFTNRVKHNIAKQGGLVELEWDGQLKREKPKPSLLLEQQQQYSQHIISHDKETHDGDETTNGIKVE